MSTSAEEKSWFMRAALTYVTPLVRETLFCDSTFRQLSGLAPDYDVTLSGAGISVRRSVLFDAVRQVLAGATAKKVRSGGR